MPMPQKFASSHVASIGGASVSTRGAVNEILQSTDMLLDAFHAEFLTKSHAWRREAQDYVKALRRSVQGAMAELQQLREDTANSVRADLENYVLNLHAAVAARLRDMAAARREIAPQWARQRAKARKVLAKCEQQHLEELVSERRRAAQALREELGDFADDLHRDVARFRKHVQRKLGTAELARHRVKPRRPNGHGRPSPHQEKHRKPNGGLAAAAPRTSPAKAARQAKAKMTAKAARHATSEGGVAH